jgi:hypothetical protein
MLHKDPFVASGSGFEKNAFGSSFRSRRLSPIVLATFGSCAPNKGAMMKAVIEVATK